MSLDESLIKHEKPVNYAESTTSNEVEDMDLSCGKTDNDDQITEQKSFCQKTGLISHLTNHLILRTFTCPRARTISFNDMSNLVRQLRQVHKASGKEVIDFRKEFNINRKTASLNSKVENSIKTICAECDMTFITSKQLMEHKKLVHDPSDILVCDVCAKGKISYLNFELELISNYMILMSSYAVFLSEDKLS